MVGAVNIDIRRMTGVDVVGTASALPFRDGAFVEVHAINPYKYQPVSTATARVMKPGGILRVTGTPTNEWVGAYAAATEAAGFRFVGEGPMEPAHAFGIQRTTAGGKLRTNHSRTWTYVRIP